MTSTSTNSTVPFLPHPQPYFFFCLDLLALEVAIFLMTLQAVVAVVMVVRLWCTQMVAASEMAIAELGEGLECIGEKDIPGKH